MSCPDEDTFARFVEGLLPPEAAAQIERHVDACARCADLAAEFGRSYAVSAEPAGRAPRLAALALALAVPVHLAWALLLPPAAAVLQASLPPGLATLVLRYGAIWAPAGGVLALGGAVGLWRGWSRGRTLAMGHAVLSLPSVVLTPLALFVMYELGRARSRGR
jgi:anti-sigma factor RsiW